METPTDESYDRLRSAILEGELTEGQVYSQIQLSTLLDVSRTPLREAIRRLQSEGLLELERHRRLRVTSLDAEDLSHLYAMRIALESLAVRLTVPKLDGVALDQIRDALDAHTAACDARDLERARGPHREFHQRLFALSGPRMVKDVQELWDHAERYRRVYFKERASEISLFQLSSEDHHAIFAAAETGDGELCGDRIAQHLSRTGLTLFAQLGDEYDPVEVRIARKIVRSGMGESG